MFCTSIAGEEIGRIRTRGTHPVREADYRLASPSLTCDIPQTYLQPILVKNATARGTQTRFSTEYLSHEQDTDGVDVRVRDRLTGAVYSIRAKYLIGADGARSMVAADAGLPMEGQMDIAGSMNITFKADISAYVGHRPRCVRRPTRAVNSRRRSSPAWSARLEPDRDPELYYQPSTVPGARLPHVWVGDSTRKLSTLDLAPFTRFTLITGIAGQAWTDAAGKVGHDLGVPLEAVVIGPGREVTDIYYDWARIREIAEEGAILVRPDKHIAWRSMGLPEAPSVACGRRCRRCSAGRPRPGQITSPADSCARSSAERPSHSDSTSSLFSPGCGAQLRMLTGVRGRSGALAD